MNNIYLDHNATTPLHEEVIEAMIPSLKNDWGNPSSIHWAGRGPKVALEAAREQVCKLLNCEPLEIIFTSSGTEGDNLAIKGIAHAKKKKGNHIITTVVEHPAVLSTCKYLAKNGYDVTYLGVDAKGQLDLKELEGAIRPETILISVMYANNETGVIFPIEEIGNIARKHKVTFHTDAVQAAGKIPLDMKTLPVDLLTISGHKLYGPKGVGALFVRRGTRVTPLLHGGHHERNRRGGTENLAGLVGFGKACEVALRDFDSEVSHVTELRDRLEKGLLDAIPHVIQNGDTENRLPNTTNISFEFIEGESILLNLDMHNIAASSGSACTSGSLEPSHVLVSMGLKHEQSHGSIRFTLGRCNTKEEVDYLIEILPPIVDRIRKMSPLYSEASGGASDLTFDEEGNCTT